MIKFLFFLFLITFNTNVFSQKDSLKSDWLVSGIIKDQGKLWASPTRIKTKNLGVLIPLAATTTVAIYYDELIYQKVNNFKTANPWATTFSSKLTYAGHGLTVLGISTSFYLAGHLTKNEKSLQTSALCMQALAHTAIFTHVTKIAFSRKRPVSGYGVDWQPDGKSVWHFFPAYLKVFKGELMSNYSSFPSGHTSTVWCMATVIAKQYHQTIWVPVLSYSIAALTGITRVVLNKHWSSDVLIGAALGYGVGHYLYKNRNNTKWMLLPSGSLKNVNITGIYTF